MTVVSELKGDVKFAIVISDLEKVFSVALAFSNNIVTFILKYL